MVSKVRPLLVWMTCSPWVEGDVVLSYMNRLLESGRLVVVVEVAVEERESVSVDTLSDDIRVGAGISATGRGGGFVAVGLGWGGVRPSLSRSLDLGL